MIIRRLETLANICNIISEYKYGFSEEFLILLIGFSEVKALMDLEYPKPKSISSYIYDNFSRELSHMTSDFDKIETVIEDVKRPDILVTRYHQGGLNAKILHDVNYLSLMDADFLIKSFYADYCYDNEEDESSKHKAWLRLFTRFSKVGDRNIIIPEIKLSPYYKERIKLVQEALSNFDKFSEYL